MNACWWRIVFFLLHPRTRAIQKITQLANVRAPTQARRHLSRVISSVPTWTNFDIDTIESQESNEDIKDILGLLAYRVTAKHGWRGT
jgi:hypothetical protein